MDKYRITLVYESSMFILAIVSISYIWIDHPTLASIDKVILLIFIIDVVGRFFFAENKMDYLKRNPFDIIAIIPFDSIFRLARIVRLIRVLRLLLIVKHYSDRIVKILKTNGLHKVISATVILIFTSAIPVKFIEPSISTYEDAIWWSIVTATTVGYGDISPETGFGRFIAVVLMVFGIGLIGMVTGSIATHFISNKNDNETINYMKSQIDHLENLNSLDIDNLILLLEQQKKRGVG